MGHGGLLIPSSGSGKRVGCPQMWKKRGEDTANRVSEILGYIAFFLSPLEKRARPFG